MDFTIAFQNSVIETSKLMFHFSAPDFKPLNNLELSPNEKLIACSLYQKDNEIGQFLMAVNKNTSHRLIEPFIEFNHESAEGLQLLNSILEEYVNNIMGNFTANKTIQSSYQSLRSSAPQVLKSPPVIPESIGLLECEKNIQIKFFLSLNSIES